MSGLLFVGEIAAILELPRTFVGFRKLRLEFFEDLEHGYIFLFGFFGKSTSDFLLFVRSTLLSQNAAGDTERPYDLLSIMHYDADSFSTSKEPTITAKDKAYALYTDDPDDYDMYRMGNRVGMTQLDADQLADLYRDVHLGLWSTWLKHRRLVWQCMAYLVCHVAVCQNLVPL